MCYGSNTTLRLIPEWTSTQTARPKSRFDDLCEQCDEPIQPGDTYRRMVYAAKHPRQKDRLEVARAHQHPVCPIYRENYK